MKSFGEHSAEEFEDILEEIASDVNVKKIIFDLRNN
jgi:C-terminal processing protease CtpA/Prc